MVVAAEFRPRSDEHEQWMLVRLADGSLSERERQAIEAYVAGSPEAQVRLARQRRVVTAFRAGGPVLSSAARARLDAQLQSAETARSPIARFPGRIALAGVGSLVALALVLVAVISAGGVKAPTISQAALLAYSPATGPAPAADPTDHRFLQARFGGITFPDYQRQFAVLASGQRTDQTGGRTIRTVYYTLPTQTRISYSIVSGSPLPPPAAAKVAVTLRGVSLRAYAHGALKIVTLVRNGRTCILAGRTSTQTLLALAEAPLENA
jgi:hypothetical protein